MLSVWATTVALLFSTLPLQAGGAESAVDGTTIRLTDEQGKPIVWEGRGLFEPLTVQLEAPAGVTDHGGPAMFVGTVQGLDVEVLPLNLFFDGDRVQCRARIQGKEAAIDVFTSEARLQSVLEAAFIRDREIEVWYSELGDSKRLTRVRIADRKPEPRQP